MNDIDKARLKKARRDPVYFMRSVAGIKLYDFQIEAIRRVHEAFERGERLLVIHPPRHWR